MYNEQVKEDYIASIIHTNTQKTLRNLFGRIGDNIENRFGKEIATMSTDEIKSGLEDMGYLSFATLRTDISFLRDYFRWYNDNIESIDYSSIENLSSSSIDVSKAVKEELIGYEEELQAFIGLCPAKEGYYEAPILCLSWLGLKIKEILELKNEDVYVKNEVVFVSTPKRTIQVNSEYVSNVLIDYSKVKSAKRQHRNEWVVYPDDIGYYIKNFKHPDRINGQRVTPQQVRRKISNFNNMNPEEYKKVTLGNVLVSGRFWRIREEERRSGIIPVDMFINEFGTKVQRNLNDLMRLYGFYKEVYGE